jgi:hypothetical protein
LLEWVTLFVVFYPIFTEVLFHRDPFAERAIEGGTRVVLLG